MSVWALCDPWNKVKWVFQETEMWHVMDLPRPPTVPKLLVVFLVWSCPQHTFSYSMYSN